MVVAMKKCGVGSEIVVICIVGGSFGLYSVALHIGIVHMVKIHCLVWRSSILACFHKHVLNILEFCS